MDEDALRGGLARFLASRPADDRREVLHVAGPRVGPHRLAVGRRHEHALVEAERHAFHLVEEHEHLVDAGRIDANNRSWDRSCAREQRARIAAARVEQARSVLENVKIANARPSPESLDRRLQAVEAKLDRLMKFLDGQEKGRDQNARPAAR